MPLLSKAAILAAQDLPHRDVEVAEWGGVVRVRMMTAGEREAFETVMMDQGKKPECIRAFLIAKCAIDESGARIFSDDDAAALGEKNAQAADRVFAAIVSLSGMGKDAVEAAKKN